MKRNASVRKSKKQALKLLHKYWPHLSKAAERAERKAISGIFKGRGKTPRALRGNPSGDDFKTERVSGNVYLMKRYDDWYPMRKTPQGGLAFLNGPGDHHDGSKASALRIAKEHLGRSNPPSGWKPCKAVKIERKGGRVVVRVKR